MSARLSKMRRRFELMNPQSPLKALILIIKKILSKKIQKRLLNDKKLMVSYSLNSHRFFLQLHILRPVLLR